MMCKMAKKGMTPSQIGVVLRDSHGIPQVRVRDSGFEMAWHGKQRLVGCDILGAQMAGYDR